MMLHPQLIGMLNSPPVDYREMSERMTDDERRKAEDDLAWLAIRCTRQTAYLTARSMGRNHDEAVKDSNRKVAKVRAALGFAYAKDDLSF